MIKSQTIVQNLTNRGSLIVKKKSNNSSKFYQQRSSY